MKSSTKKSWVLVFFLLVTAAASEALQAGDFTYIGSGISVTITGYTGSGGAIAIPPAISGKPVRSIGDIAFNYCTNLTSITIPDSVTFIGNGAFQGCNNLTSITIPDSVTFIGNGAFYGCTSLPAISVNSLNSFFSSIDGVLFNKSQTNLVAYPAGKLGNYTIPDSVTTIGHDAFISCASLTGVTIGNGVASVGDGVFRNCTSLAAIMVNTLNSFFSSLNGVLFNKSQTKLVAYPAGKLGNYTIPDSVTTIGHDAFISCASLSSVTIPDSVASIGDWAFSECTNLTSILIPDGITSIGEGTLSGCNSLSSITIPDSVTIIGHHAFSGCTSLTSITIPDGVASIGSGTFSWCTSLSSITIPDSVASIGDTMFASCASLTSITIPDSVASIGIGAFAGCTKLTSVTIPDSVASIGDWAFAGCTNLSGIYFKGNTPSLGGALVFDNAPNVTVYYLFGTTDWGMTFGGQSTVLWSPLIQLGDGSFGVQTNGFGFSIAGAGSELVVVEACTNLSSRNWKPIVTNTLTSGSGYFSDPGWIDHSAHYYRLSMP